MNDSLALGLAVGQRGQRLSISTGFTAGAPGTPIAHLADAR